MDKKLKQGSLSQGKIQAKPVLEALRQPDYPTQAGRWGKTASGAATFFLAISIGSCAESQAIAENVNPPAVSQQAEQMPGNSAQQNAGQQSQGTIVAPIFEHGDGRGATGCVVVAPPVFLSEEEAMQVIKEELGKHGIKLDKGGEIEGVMMQMPIPNSYDFKKLGLEKFKKPTPLSVDAKERDKGIAIEFVSKSDLNLLCIRNKIEVLSGSGGVMHLSSVSRYETKSIACYLAKEAAGKGNEKVFLGFFYDPVESIDVFANTRETWKAIEEGREVPEKKQKPMSREELRKKAENESKKKLRQQVSDFANWLNEQGVEGVGQDSPK